MRVRVRVVFNPSRYRQGRCVLPPAFTRDIVTIVVTITVSSGGGRVDSLVRVRAS